MQARAVVEDPLCFTELKLTFRNPQPRRETAATKPGRVTIPLLTTDCMTPTSPSGIPN